MFRVLVSGLILMGLVGCSGASKKDEKPADAKSAPADVSKEASKDAKADKKDTKADKKDKKGKKAAAAAAVAGEASSAPAGAVTCTSGQDKRVISIKVVDQGCEVVYEKGGATTSPGSGKSGLGNCTRIQGKIKENLEKAGYTCS